MMRRKRREVSISALVCSLLIAGMVLLGVLAKDEVIDGTYSIRGKAGFVGCLICGIALTAVLYFVICVIFQRTAGSADRQSSDRNSADRGERKSSGGKFWKPLYRLCFSDDKFRFVPVWLFILVCWAPYLIIRFPGNYDPDTQAQIIQFYNYTALSDHHPVFDTLIFGAFWKVGELLGSERWALFFYAAFQNMATAAAFSATASFVFSHSRRRKPVVMMVLFYAFYPVIPAFSMTMTKDTLNGWIFVFIFLMTLEIISTKGEVLKSWRFLVLYTVVCFAGALTKKTTIYIVVLTLVVLFFWVHQKKRLLLSLAVLLVLYQGVWTSAVLPALGAGQGEAREKYSVFSQQTAYYIRLYGDEMSEEDLDAISQVFNDPEKMAEEYNPTRADATKNHWINSAGTDQIFTYMKWYMKAWTTHPKTMLLSAVANAYPLFVVDVETEGDESLLFYRDNVKGIHDSGNGYEDTLLSWSKEGVTAEQIHDLMGSSYRPDWSARLSDAMDALYLNIAEGLAPLFSKVLFTTWIPLLILFYAFYRRNGRIFLGVLPALLNTLTLFAGPIVLPRYMVVSVYMAPILILLPWILNINNPNCGNISNNNENS